ncbi:hypothetical protein [Iodobacter sp.]|uniref:hypothetical protein n=1 Tax=Iodobacter sp. TaxID=1915058 RepID=UPI0025DEA552|nr:hypothetical protein [Iodobacter sp.]
MSMRVVALLCALLISLTAYAEDAPLPFDVPSAAPVIQRTAVSKPATRSVERQANSTKISAKSHRAAKKHTSSAKQRSSVSGAKKHKVKGAKVNANQTKKTKGKVVSISRHTPPTKGHKAARAKHTTKRKVATHKKR